MSERDSHKAQVQGWSRKGETKVQYSRQRDTPARACTCELVRYQEGICFHASQCLGVVFCFVVVVVVFLRENG